MGRDANAAADERGRRRAGLPALLLRNRGLILITALTVIVTSAIVYLAMLATVAVDEVDLLASHLSSLPGLLDERLDRLEDMGDEYVEDCSVKTDVGVLLFEEFTEYEDSARLEQIKSSVSAVDVSLVKPDGTIVATTRTEGSFPLDAREVREVLDGDQGQLDRFEDLFSGDGTEESTEPERDQAERPTSQLDVRETLASYGLEAFPPFLDAERLRSGNSLVFEYDYTEFGTFSIEHTGWEIFLREFLSGLDAYAFVWFEDAQNFIGHPQDEQFQDAS